MRLLTNFCLWQCAMAMFKLMTDELWWKGCNVQNTECTITNEYLFISKQVTVTLSQLNLYTCSCTCLCQIARNPALRARISYTWTFPVLAIDNVISKTLHWLAHTCTMLHDLGMKLFSHICI